MCCSYWRSRAVRKPHVNRIKGIAEPTQLNADEQPDLIKDTCLLIACHQSCLTKDMQATFSNTIRYVRSLEREPCMAKYDSWCFD